MKFFIINSFRSMVYIAYFAIIAALGYEGYSRRELFAADFGLTEPMATGASIAVGLFAGWIAATLVSGLIVTLLDIRDDLNDGLPKLDK